MKKDWVAEAKRRVQADFEIAGTCLMMAQAKVSDRIRKGFQLSKTQIRKAELRQDEWLRTRLSRLAVLEVLLESRPGLGRRVWRLYSRMTAAMAKRATMVPVPGAVPAEQRAPKGAGDEVVREADASAVL
jgi:hypothetical protein